MIKSTISLLTLLLAFGYASAQIKPIVKSPSNSNQNQSKSSQATKPVPPPPPPAPRVPTGPSGLGSLKIGMSKEAVEKLTESDGVFLQSPMTPYEYKYGKPVEGVDKFNAKLMTPLSTQSVASELSFQNDELIALKLDFKSVPGGYERSLREITEKYGQGKETNDRTEEQCIYKSGANFKITDGTIQHTWTDDISKTEPVQTQLTDWISNSCPANLRYAVGEIGFKLLTIEKLKPSSKSEKKNLF